MSACSFFFLFCLHYSSTNNTVVFITFAYVSGLVKCSYASVFTVTVYAHHATCRLS